MSSHAIQDMQIERGLLGRKISAEKWERWEREMDGIKMTEIH